MQNYTCHAVGSLSHPGKTGGTCPLHGLFPLPATSNIRPSCRAKNHISPGEPYFAIFYHNNFQGFEANFSHFFYLLGKNVFGSHWHKNNKSVSVKNAENTGN